jgi:thymidylate synthase
MPSVQHQNCLGGWQEGVRHLLTHHGEEFNLVTTIENPTTLSNAWLGPYSPHTAVATGDRLKDVINTIFPYRLRARHANRNAFYDAYMQIHSRGRKFVRNRSRWGTYFERLIAFEGNLNQLERAIGKLNTWDRNTTGLVFHLSSPSIDRPRTRGGPCLHYIELLWKPGHVIDLVAVYRNHDYFNKTFGNFIALGQLLSFISAETNKLPGKLICHSVHAYTDSSLARLKQLAQV